MSFSKLSILIKEMSSLLAKLVCEHVRTRARACVCTHTHTLSEIQQGVVMRQNATEEGLEIGAALLSHHVLTTVSSRERSEPTFSGPEMASEK